MASIRNKPPSSNQNDKRVRKATDALRQDLASAALIVQNLSKQNLSKVNEEKVKSFGNLINDLKSGKGTFSSKDLTNLDQLKSLLDDSADQMLTVNKNFEYELSDIIDNYSKIASNDIYGTRVQDQKLKELKKIVKSGGGNVDRLSLTDLADTQTMRGMKDQLAGKRISATKISKIAPTAIFSKETAQQQSRGSRIRNRIASSAISGAGAVASNVSSGVLGAAFGAAGLGALDSHYNISGRIHNYAADKVSGLFNRDKDNYDVIRKDEHDNTKLKNSFGIFNTAYGNSPSASSNQSSLFNSSDSSQNSTSNSTGPRSIKNSKWGGGGSKATNAEVTQALTEVVNTNKDINHTLTTTNSKLDELISALSPDHRQDLHKFDRTIGQNPEHPTSSENKSEIKKNSFSWLDFFKKKPKMPRLPKIPAKAVASALPALGWGILAGGTALGMAEENTDVVNENGLSNALNGTETPTMKLARELREERQKAKADPSAEWRQKLQTEQKYLETMQQNRSKGGGLFSFFDESDESKDARIKESQDRIKRFQDKIDSYKPEDLNKFTESRTKDDITPIQPTNVPPPAAPVSANNVETSAPTPVSNGNDPYTHRQYNFNKPAPTVSTTTPIRTVNVPPGPNNNSITNVITNLDNTLQQLIQTLRSGVSLGGGSSGGGGYSSGGGISVGDGGGGNTASPTGTSPNLGPMNITSTPKTSVGSSGSSGSSGTTAPQSGGSSGGGSSRNTPSTGGSVATKGNGTRSWRNNNPGNIEYGKYTKSMGAVGSDGRFAIFPTYEAGRKAQQHLLFQSGTYKNLTLAQAINKWAPGSENNVPAYIKAMGADPNTKMSDFTPEQQGKLLDAMQTHEGYKEGRTKAQGTTDGPSAQDSQPSNAGSIGKGGDSGGGGASASTTPSGIQGKIVDDTSKIVGSANAAKPGGMFGTPQGSGDKDFQKNHLSTITLDSGKKVTVNSVSAPAFKGLFNELEKGGYNINSIAGYNYRNVRGGSSLSQHSYGNAVDVNPAQNPMGVGDHRNNLPANISQMAAKYGITWGGDWKHRQDNMHFEYTGMIPKNSPLLQNKDNQPAGPAPTADDLEAEKQKQMGIFKTAANPFMKKAVIDPSNATIAPINPTIQNAAPTAPTSTNQNPSTKEPSLISFGTSSDVSQTQPRGSHGPIGAVPTPSTFGPSHGPIGKPSYVESRTRDDRYIPDSRTRGDTEAALQNLGQGGIGSTPQRISGTSAPYTLDKGDIARNVGEYKAADGSIKVATVTDNEMGREGKGINTGTSSSQFTGWDGPKAATKTSSSSQFTNWDSAKPVKPITDSSPAASMYKAYDTTPVKDKAPSTPKEVPIPPVRPTEVIEAGSAGSGTQAITPTSGGKHEKHKKPNKHIDDVLLHAANQHIFNHHTA